MGYLQDLYNKAKKSLNDNEGWFRQGQFTPVKQLTGKPLIQSKPLVSPIPQSQVIQEPKAWINPYEPTVIEPPKPSFKTQAATKLNSRLDQIKRYGSSTINNLDRDKTIPGFQVAQGGLGNNMSNFINDARQKAIVRNQAIKENTTKSINDYFKPSPDGVRTRDVLREAANIVTDVPKGFIGEYMGADPDKARFASNWKDDGSFPETGRERYGKEYEPKTGAQKLGSTGYNLLEDFATGEASGINRIIGEGLTSLSYTKPGQFVVNKLDDLAKFGQQNVDDVINNMKPVDMTFDEVRTVTSGNATPEQVNRYKRLVKFAEDKGVNIRELIKTKKANPLESVTNFISRQFRNLKPNKVVTNQADDITKLLTSGANQVDDVVTTPTFTNRLDISDYNNFLKPKLERAVSTLKPGQITVIQTGDGLWLDTIPEIAVNRGINANTKVFNIDKNLIQSTGNTAKDARGERLLKEVLPKEAPVVPPVVSEVITPEDQAIQDILKYTQKPVTKPGMERISPDYLPKIGQGYQVNGTEINFEKMMNEGWKPDQIDYAVKLANESRASIKDPEAYVRGILKTQYPGQAAKMGGSQVPLPPEPSADELAQMNSKIGSIDDILEPKPQTKTYNSLDYGAIGKSDTYPLKQDATPYQLKYGMYHPDSRARELGILQADIDEQAGINIPKVPEVETKVRSWKMDEEPIWENPNSKYPTKINKEHPLGLLELMDEGEYTPETRVADIKNLREIGFSDQEIKDIVSGKSNAFDIYVKENNLTFDNTRGWITDTGKVTPEVKPQTETQIGELQTHNTQTEPINEVLRTNQTKPIVDDIAELNTIHPPKANVMGKTAEEAYKNLNTHGSSLVDRISSGIKENNVSKANFVKYVENPELAPAEVKPLVEAHRQLVETLHSVRENPKLGTIDNYFPHMDSSILETPPELKNLGDDLWVSDFTTQLGTSETRTGTMTDYSTEYDKVMKNYVDQSAYDKYGDRLHATPESIKFKNKVDEHLAPKDATKPIAEDNLLEPPTDEFDYIEETRIKNNSETTPVTAKVEQIDSFDSLKRKIATEDNQQAMVKSMEDLRDARDLVGELMAKIEGLDTKGQIKLLSDELDYVSSKIDLTDRLNQLTKNGTKPISKKVLAALLKAEKDFRLQGFIDEAGKHTYHKKTKEYLNQQIDRLVKKGKYEQAFLDRAVNFTTSTFYKAQIWGNVNTGVKQKLEITKLPVIYNPDIIAAGIKQQIADKRAGAEDILKRYDFANTETNISKQLGFEAPKNTKGTVNKIKDIYGNVEEKAGKVGNLFVNIGENSKNRDFLYAAEAQGKSLGLEGKDLKRFVRNELFANGYILHEFNTPKMLKNPLVRLGLQYQQYNIQLINKVIELSEEGGYKNYAKAGGLVGSQAISLIILGLITGKGIGTVKDQLGLQFGPAFTLTRQAIGLINDAKRAEREGDALTASTKREQAAKLIKRNTLWFANQYYKSTDAKKVIDDGYATSGKGSVRYATGDLNLLDKGRALIFGQSTIPSAVENNKAWDDFESGKTNVMPILTRNESAILKSKTNKDDQLAYFDKIMARKVPNKAKIQQIKKDKDDEKDGFLSNIFGGKKEESTQSIADILTSPDTTQADKARAKSEIKAFIDEGYGGDPEVVADEDLKEYFYGEVNKMPESTNSEKQAKNIAQFKKLGSILDSETLDEPTKDRLIAMTDVPKEEVEYYVLASDDKTVKAMRQEELLSGMKREDWLAQLQEGRRLVGNKQIVDNQTLDELYERGALSDAERDYLKAIKFDPGTGKYYFDRDYKGGGSGSSASSIAKKKLSLYNSLKSSLDTINNKDSSSVLKKSIASYLSSDTAKPSTNQTIGSLLTIKKTTPKSVKTDKVVSRVKSKYRFSK